MTLNTAVYQEIIKLVNAGTGLKGTELVLKVITNLHPSCFDVQEFEYALEVAAQKGEIIKLEYTVPYMDYRIKYLLFPKETKFVAVVCGNETIRVGP